MRVSKITSCLVFVCLVLGVVPTFALAQVISVEPPVSIPSTLEFTVAIAMDTEGAEVMGLEIELSFDNTVVRLNSIQPGPWYTDSSLDYFFWDYTTNGCDRIHFTGSQLNAGDTRSDVVAICHFTALTAGISDLEFLDVDVRDAQNVDLGASHSTGDQIVIEEAVDTNSIPWGSVKATYWIPSTTE